MPRKEFKPQRTGPQYRTHKEALAALTSYVDEFAASVTGKVPIDEKLSWAAKEVAAQAVSDGVQTADQLKLLKDEADLTGETPQALAATVLAKASVYRSVVSRIAGLRRVTTTAIEAADRNADPNVYDTILAGAKTQAESLAASLGL